MLSLENLSRSRYALIMHILFVTHYFEPDSGAAAVRLSRLARQLHGRGHRITVLTTLPHYPKGEIREGYHRKFSVSEDRDGIRVIRAWLWATPSKKISRRLISQFSFMLSASLRGIFLPRPDVIFIEAQPIFTGLAGRWVSLIKRRPYLLNVSDLWPDHLVSVGVLTESHLAYRIARRVVDSNYRRAKKVVGMIAELSEKISGYIGSSDTVHTIYNGVDLDKFHPQLATDNFREQYHLPDKKLITFIGTFATAYNLSMMLDVIERLQHREDVAFVFIGAGTQAETLNAEIDKRHLTNLHLIDWLNHEEIPQAWASSYLCYWAIHDKPLYEGTVPAKLYEAFASGVPIVGANGQASRRMMEASGGSIAVKPSDLNGLVAGIERFLDDPDYHIRCSQAVRHYAEEHLDSAKVTTAYEQLLQEINPMGEDE